VFVGFAGTVVFGLAVSGWYLSNRMLAAEGARFDAPAPPTATVSTPAPPVEKPSVTETVEQLISLQPELYLEMSALGSPQDATYLRQLQARGFPGRIEAGQADQAGHILIGPYADRSALKQARRRLAATGILAVETVR
jgi:cell division septation protein DedD